MRIVFVGGGTGGHFYPLIAVAEAIRTEDKAANLESDLIYMGPDPYDQAILDSYGIRFVYCPAGKQRRYFSIFNILDKFKIITGIFVSLWKLFFLYPDVIMSKGSYTSVPVILVAWWYRIPIVVHESDAKPGRANKLAGKFAKYIGVSLPSAAEYFDKAKVAHVGMPIRHSFKVPIADPYKILSITHERPIIFVTGGSSGAERLNNFILDTLDELLPNYTIIHQTGKGNFDKVRDTAAKLIVDAEQQNRYLLYPNMSGDEMAAALQAADLVIARSGAGTIAEIALKEKPAILVPIPEKISHDQRTNAYAYAETGAALVLEEENMSDGLLAAEVNKILSNKALYDQMTQAAAAFTQPHAADKIANILRQVANEHA